MKTGNLLFSNLFMLCCLSMGSSELDGGFGYGGAASGAIKKNHIDNFRRGFETRNEAALDNVDAKNLQSSYDRSSVASEAAKTAQIGAAGVPGGYVGAVGSHGAEKKQLFDQFDRGSHETAFVGKQNARSSDYDRKLDTGVTKATQKAASVIGGNGFVGGSRGNEVKKLFQKRRQEAESGQANAQAVLNADEDVERFDRGVTSKSAASAAHLNQAAGLYGDGGAFGSGGIEDARVDSQHDRGYKRSTNLVAAKKHANSVAKDYDDRELKQVHAAKANLFGGLPYGPAASGGASAAKKISNIDRGSLLKEDVGESQRAQSENVKHLNSDWKSASTSSNVDIGQGLHGAAGSEGARANVLVKGHDNEFAKEKALSLQNSQASKYAKTFDQSNSAHTQDANTVINPGHLY